MEPVDQNPDSEPADAADHTPDNSVMDSIVPPVRPKHFLAAILKVLLIIVLIVALAGGAFWFFTRPKPSPKPATTAKTSTTNNANTSPTKITSATKRYDSSNYNLSFEYPSDWTISDEATAKLTATSPPLRLVGENGDAFTGQIVFAVQNQQTSIAAFAKNKAVAVLESQKIAYKQPTSNQRAQTYVTFVNYSGSMALIDSLYITGDNGYQAQQDVPQSDVVQANPLVTVSFLKCADAACKTTGTASSILVKAWADPTVSKPILNLLESLTIE